MNQIETENYNLSKLTKVNVLLGKNGCGKSTILRDVSRCTRYDNTLIRYITPQRGGELNYNLGVEQTIIANVGWLDTTDGVIRFLILSNKL